MASAVVGAVAKVVALAGIVDDIMGGGTGERWGEGGALIG